MKTFCMFCDVFHTVVWASVNGPHVIATTTKCFCVYMYVHSNTSSMCSSCKLIRCMQGVARIKVEVEDIFSNEPDDCCISYKICRSLDLLSKVLLMDAMAVSKISVFSQLNT